VVRGRYQRGILAETFYESMVGGEEHKQEPVHHEEEEVMEDDEEKEHEQLEGQEEEGEKEKGSDSSSDHSEQEETAVGSINEWLAQYSARGESVEVESVDSDEELDITEPLY